MSHIWGKSNFSRGLRRGRYEQGTRWGAGVFKRLGRVEGGGQGRREQSWRTYGARILQIHIFDRKMICEIKIHNRSQNP